MKFGKIFIFAVILLLGVTLVYPQRIIGPTAKWNPASISVNHNVIVEGTDIEISATFKVLRNVTGLRYEAGVGTQMLSHQTCNDQLNTGAIIPVKFTWKAVRGRHNLFFRLIPPRPNRSDPIQKLNKTINVVPRIQDPTQTNAQTQSNIPTKPQHMCSAFKNTPQRLQIKELTIAVLPQNHSDPAVINVTIHNPMPRCVEVIYLIFQAYPSLGQYQNLTLTPEDFNKKNYILKKGESLSHIISLYKPNYSPNEIISENGTAVAKLYKFRLYVPTADSKLFSIQWPLPPEE